MGFTFEKLSTTGLGGIAALISAIICGITAYYFRKYYVDEKWMKNLTWTNGIIAGIMAFAVGSLCVLGIVRYLYNVTYGSTIHVGLSCVVIAIASVICWVNYYYTYKEETKPTWMKNLQNWNLGIAIAMIVVGLLIIGVPVISWVISRF